MALFCLLEPFVQPSTWRQVRRSRFGNVSHGGFPVSCSAAGSFEESGNKIGPTRAQAEGASTEVGRDKRGGPTQDAVSDVSRRFSIFAWSRTYAET